MRVENLERRAGRLQARQCGPRHGGFLAVACPQTSIKVVGGQVTSVLHMLAMAFDDPTMDDDLRAALAAHDIVLGDEWADVE